MDTIKDELNQAAEGHSHYFLNEPLTILDDPAFPIQSEELRRILDLAAAALSVGPRVEGSSDPWSLLRPSDWFRAATHTMAAILRGCVRTKNIGQLGNFSIHPLRDTYRRSTNLPDVETQCDLLEAIAFQITKHLTLDNGPYLPQDSIDGIRATVWRAHEAQIRMAVSQKANEVEHKLTTMGLVELVDNLLNEASTEEITNTVREDIALQTRSKYNNAKLDMENKAYHEFINQAMAEGKDRAVKEALETYAVTSKNLREMKEKQAKDDANKYYQKLLETAKEQARLKADSEFSRLLADERSAIAPRVDAEIALEHRKLVQERRIATEAQLQALTLEEEKKLVRVAATRLGMSLKDDEHTAKKVKVDQRKARPAPVTPRGRSSSVVSTSSNTRKRAYSPSEAQAPTTPPARDEQKTPTPKTVTTVNFEIKAEPTPQPTFATPSTPSVIRDAVNIAQDVSLRSSSSSIHNEANHMAIDPEHLNLANIFPPGIPPPPIDVSLPPPMSQTPPYGGAEAHEDGAAPSASPEVPEANASEIRLFALMQKFNQPIWDTIHRIEQALGDGRIPRVPQRAGPGYRSEHIHKQAARVPSAPNGPEVTTQTPRERQVSQAAPPFPSEPPVPERSTPPADTIARVDDDDVEFPALESTSRGTRRRRNTAATIIQQRRNIPGATGPDDGHIPITNNNSRIKPLFANIITREAVAQQQNIQTSAAQARRAQGRKPSGNQGTRKAPSDGNMTEVTVIRFGGLEDKEEERKFRARNPVEIIQSVQRDLARQAKNLPAVLSGRWSTTADTTGNFVYTIAGIIPPRDLMSLKLYLCRPFKGRTELVPTKGWTWIQLRLVPTEDLDGCVWGPDDLLNQFIANPCFQDALICIAPHWQGNPLNNDKEKSTVLAAIIDEDNAICQNALTHGVRMFGAQVKFLRCGDNPTLLQCSRCHLLGHYASSSKCKMPKNGVKCYRCGGNHDGRDHDYECNSKSHKILGKCDCSLKCLLCKKTDHHARSRKCLKRGDFNPPRLPDRGQDEPFQIVGKKRNTKGKQRAEPYSPPLSAFIVPEVKNIPLAQCPTEKDKNVLFCMCCPLPSVAEYQKRFVSPRPNVTDTTALPTARIISSKGKSIQETKMRAHSYEPWTDTTMTKLWSYFMRRKKKSSQKSKFTRL
ncbi:hypothetical protein V8E53_008591 [Lactarius tabidus]